jgi:peptidoglycan/LPS O-acetylase OafA/YrhL
MFLVWPDLEFAYTMPITCLDALGVGAFLAVTEADGDDPSRWVGMLFWPALCCWAALNGLGRADFNQSLTCLETTALVFVFGSWVWGAWNGQLPAFMGWRAFVWVGRISYGVYLWHMFARSVVGFGAPAAARPALYLVLTVVIAGASWLFLERPINRLKALFPWPTAPSIALPDLPRPSRRQ